MGEGSGGGDRGEEEGYSDTPQSHVNIHFFCFSTMRRVVAVYRGFHPERSFEPIVWVSVQ